jgi:hypothetical protein
VTIYYECQQMLPLSFFFLSNPVPYSIPSFLNVTVLHYSIFTKAVCIQSNQQFALSRLMCCGSTVFPCQVLERTPAREILIRCEALQNIRNLKIHSVVYQQYTSTLLLSKILCGRDHLQCTAQLCHINICHMPQYSKVTRGTYNSHFL